MFVFNDICKNYKTGGKDKMRNAEKFTDKALKVVERIARKEVEKTMAGRVTECAAIWHQPKRPNRKDLN